MGVVDGVKYVYHELRDNYTDPIWWRDRITQRVVAPIHARYPGYDDTMDVMNADWDTLIVLDACRADLFEAVADWERFDEYTRVVSPGSMTSEWTERSFAGRAFGDTVYVTANPYTMMVAGDSFHQIVNVWEKEFDEESGTVPPQKMREAAQEAADTFPNKRLIVHFMQPHYPFVNAPELSFDGWDPDRMQTREYKDSDGPTNVWQALELGIVDKETVWDAYADNLRLGLSAAHELVDELDGRTVFTSDHGNMLGEWAWPVPIRLYGHPRNLRTPELVEVPWAIFDDERRTTTDEGTTDTSREADAAVKRRLRELGYA